MVVMLSVKDSGAAKIRSANLRGLTLERPILGQLRRPPSKAVRVEPLVILSKGSQTHTHLT